MKTTLEQVGVLVSNLDETSPLAEGFHVVSIPTDFQWTNLQSPKTTPYEVVALATAEPDAHDLLSVDDNNEVLAMMSATSLMKVEVSHTSPGGESEYLPDAYKPLYQAKDK